MTREDVIRMAREQGLPETEVEGVFRVNTDDLGRFAALVKERTHTNNKARWYQEGVEAERNNPDPLHLSRILHELAGAASMCWNPRPTGVFDSQEAIGHVVAAIQEIRSRMDT